ncbi:hypothetical protein [Paraburkholderia bryophila]|uniref:Uncharacterized protein n=1 Tax=Paraburkholderia bryophila TaxID=420952 RepID=A0A7Y9WIE5_9BURK|nr:hypothetical protein [Paraburkholderia bryophila]NYH21432.1 hypothetical protein [Paraburkholderia bryophila]
MRDVKQFERFKAYMDSPCHELDQRDLGRNDPHRLVFAEWGVPQEFLLWLWQAAEKAALTPATDGQQVVYQVQSTAGGWVDVAETHYERTPLEKRIVYTHPASPDSVRRDALEEAAKVCDERALRLTVAQYVRRESQNCALAIRALSQQPDRGQS